MHGMRGVAGWGAALALSVAAGCGSSVTDGSGGAGGTGASLLRFLPAGVLAKASAPPAMPAPTMAMS